MDDCVTMLGQGEDTELDILLATQAKYHAAMGHVADICPEPAAPHEDSLLIPVYLIKSMDLQLQSIRQSVLMHLQTSSKYISTLLSPFLFLCFGGGRWSCSGSINLW